MHITLVAGARPNFMKVAPIIRAIEAAQGKGGRISCRLVHTGQHYDDNLSRTFFDELNIPEPQMNLACGGGTQAEQTAAIMVAFEKDLMANPSDLVMVVGDVTSTMACAIVAKKLNTKVAHVEAGIRSGDMSMPEEINRMVTDSITDYFFTTSEFANGNLLKMGVSEARIHFVGNVMIDTLMANRKRFRRPAIHDRLSLQAGQYIVMTLHRPANVDDPDKLRAFIQVITSNVRGLPVLFPVHPRTAERLNEVGIQVGNLHLLEPMGYLEFNYLVERAKLVITDSGGITEETTVMGIPCITLRDNTERPETVSIGTNELVGTNPSEVPVALGRLFSGTWKSGRIPERWDGNAAARIVETLLSLPMHV